MISLKNKTFFSPKKADAEVVAGGNFYYKVYTYKIKFDEVNTVKLYQVIQANDRNKSEREKLVFEGTYDFPKMGSMIWI